MTYIDTNYLVRIITNDVPELAKKAAYDISCEDKGALTIHHSVLSELCLILQYHRYKMTHMDIADAIMSVLQLPQFSYPKDVAEVLQMYQNNNTLDYVDCVLLFHSKSNKVLTFDKKLQKAINDRAKN